MKRICVIGSLNVDLTIGLPRFHNPGETITAETINTYPGGKGGNQAIAVSRLGLPVIMVGMLGEDNNGDFYRDVLHKSGVDMSCVLRDGSCPTGTAIIEVNAQGENRIAIIPGANRLVNREFIDRNLNMILKNDIYLMQFEIPLDTNCYIVEELHKRGKLVILDPAPAVPVPDSLYRNMDYITPNLTELSILTGLPTNTYEQIVKAVRVLISLGAHAVIAKMGSQGCLYGDAQEIFAVRSYRVQVVDTTAAGDSFNAGLAVALAEGMPIRSALAFANAVGALSTTGAGAQSSMPSMEEVQLLIKKGELEI